MTEPSNVTTLNDKYLRVFGIPISVTAVLLWQMHYFFPGRWDLFVRYTAIALISTTLIWEIARQILMGVRRRFPGIQQTKQRMLWIFGLFPLKCWLHKGY